jgi:hypothetical protein
MPRLTDRARISGNVEAPQLGGEKPCKHLLVEDRSDERRLVIPQSVPGVDDLPAPRLFARRVTGGHRSLDACDQRAGGRHAPADQEEVPEVVPQVRVAKQRVQRQAFAGRMVEIEAVVSRVDVDQHEIRLVGGVAELDDGPVVGDVRAADPEVEQVEVAVRTGSSERRLQERHHVLGVRHETVRERVADGHDPEAARRLGHGELLVVEAQRVRPVVEPSPVGDDVRGLGGEVLLETREAPP